MQRLLFLLCLTLSAVGFGNDLDYDSFNSIEDVIEYETAILVNVPKHEYEHLANAYLCRGESYLLSHKYEEAIFDLQESLKLAKFCDVQQIKALEVRALFCLAVSYGNLELMTDAYISANLLKEVLQSCTCTQCHEYNNQKLSNLNYTTTVDQPILGPDRISISECLDRVKGIKHAAKLLILKSRSEVQYMLNMLIDDIADRGELCCRKGGIWKACLQPIVNKWHIWNEKWNVFGIPPDPNWD